MYYQLTIAFMTFDGEWRGMRQLPTILLDERTLGIVDVNHARKIGMVMLNDINPSINPADVSINVDIVRA